MLLLVLAGLFACDFSAVEVVDPPPPESVDVTLTLVAREADDVTAALGWNGAVPNAQVRLLSETRSELWAGMSDESGRVDLGRIDAGTYTIDVLRLLTADEVETSGAPDLVGFAEEATVTIAAGMSSREVSVHPSYRGAIVISEAFVRGLPAPGVGGSYHGSTYLEIYNNSDTTINLEGMIIAMGWQMFVATVPLPCSESVPWRLSEGDFYSDSFAHFPAGHSLAPGEAAVLAGDAIDHSALEPSYPDMSTADFEFIGGADPDNPQVPNMVNGGEPARYGHGLLVEFFTPLLVIRPIDTAQLPIRITPYNGRRWTAFPRTMIADFWYDRGKRWPGILRPCAEDILPVFDREPAELYTGYPRDPYEAVHRKVIAYTADGRAILQDTRSSRSDLIVGVRSPGSVGTTVIR